VLEVFDLIGCTNPAKSGIFNAIAHCECIAWCAIPPCSVAEKKKQKLPMIVRKLVSWRKKNGLSQRAAAVVMQERQCDILLSSLQAWEQGKRQPGRSAKKVLSTFLDRNPTVENPPVFKPGPKK
jgi:DNA-binding transcriptional regulator YiaG